MAVSAGGYRNIVFPVDFSEVSISAARRAVWLAQRFGARLHVVNVVDASVYAYAGYSFSDLRGELFSAASTQLEKLKLPSGSTKVDVVRKVLEGNVAAEIANYCLEVKSDLLVMASHGRGKVARFFLGSIADKLLNAAPCPMLLMRAPAGTVKHPVTKDRGFKRILVPTDFSETSQLGLNRGSQLAEEFKAELQLLHVVDNNPLMLLDATTRKRSLKELQEQAHSKLEKLTASIPSGARVRIDVKVGEPAKVIGQVAMADMADLVVIGSHGRGEFARLFLGSVADAVVRVVECPVLVEHAPRSA